MAVLRYIGPIRTTFKDVAKMPTWNNQHAAPLIARVGELKPGQEFSVPDELADRFTGRSDIEIVVPPITVEEPAAAPEAEAAEPAAETADATSGASTAAEPAADTAGQDAAAGVVKKTGRAKPAAPGA